MIILGTQLNFLQRATIHTGFVHQVKRQPRAFCGRSNLGIERHRFGWIYLGNRRRCDGVTVFIVKARYEVPRIKHPKRPGEADLAVLSDCRSQRPNQNPRVRNAVELTSGMRGEPLRVQGATLSGTQTTHGTIVSASR